MQKWPGGKRELRKDYSHGPRSYREKTPISLYAWSQRYYQLEAMAVIYDAYFVKIMKYLWQREKMIVKVIVAHDLLEKAYELKEQGKYRYCLYL